MNRDTSRVDAARNERDNEMAQLHKDLKVADADIVRVQKTLLRADQWLEAVMRDADRVFKVSRGRKRVR